MSAAPLDWLPFVGLTLAVEAVVVIVAVAFAALLIGCLRLLDAADGEKPPNSGESGPGGGAPGPPVEPPDGGGEPPWWPDFERELAAWLGERAATAARSAGPNA